jgi:glutaredoxin
MKQPNVTVYGSRHCPDTTRALRFLDSQGIQYEFKDLDESPELNDYIAHLNQGKRVTPTIQIDNEVRINPSDQELGAAIRNAAAARA